jgi:hypothetical protein
MGKPDYSLQLAKELDLKPTDKLAPARMALVGLRVYSGYTRGSLGVASG